ncbi:MAG TPA: glycine zipper 2TM domain-containing protein [Hyphomonadaceae bacterium]|nr:glycine zipper 2TM domain-containing protein [Hyphomonadaceae bacterium]
MRSAIIAAVSVIALSPALAPSASAQVQACEQHNNQVAGTVVGAIGGAALGSALSAHGHKDTGTIVGGIAGAIIGNQVGKSSTTVDCAHAYGYYDNGGAWHANPVSRDVARGYYDRNGRWYDGTPNGYYDNNGVWVVATADMRQGYYDGNGRWVPPYVNGYYDPGNRWVAVAAPAPAPVYANNDYWRDAPRDARNRAEWLRDRVRRAEDDRRISHREADNLLDDIRNVESREARMPHRNGGLNYRDEQIIQAQLDDINRDFRNDMRG